MQIVQGANDLASVEITFISVKKKEKTTNKNKFKSFRNNEHRENEKSSFDVITKKFLDLSLSKVKCRTMIY